MDKQFEGSCLCGKVRYVVKGPFLRFFFCHCSRCRRATGSAHAANLFTRAGNVTFTAGEDSIRRYDLPEAQHFSRAFCTICGSAVPYLSRDGRVHVVPAGPLGDFDARKVDANVFWDSRAVWYEDGLNAPRKTESELKAK
ncbi:MAG: GFA family protein [Turneriella sp.]|nr:GFA family protein [Leptospiraceae bacterium]MCX7632553.1 GFA family protein [Turneriella sp.]